MTARRTPPRRVRTLAALALGAALSPPVGSGLASGAGGPQDATGTRLRAGEPPARVLSRELCALPRLAGTTSSRRAVELVQRWLEEAGLEASLEAYDVLLSYPRRLELRLAAADGRTLAQRVTRWDPDAVPAGDVPRYNAWSASGRVEGEVVDVGRGLRADYERLAAEGIPVAGRIALCRYGGSYRGVKVELAGEHGCLGVLLFDDPEASGDGRGPTWPAGPWRPGWAAQRGSICGLARTPGDPSTPGFPSPRSAGFPPPDWPPAPPAAGRPRLAAAEVDARLPRLPCLPIGADDARALLAAGPGARAMLDLDVPRRVRRVVNVVGRLSGTTGDWVLAGNHRDAWVRGGQDAGSGTVSLLRAAQRLGERARTGWKPRCGIAFAFWDAEEFGLIGSTEWAETHADFLRSHALAYVNADAVVSGLEPGASGTPGLLGVVRAAMERVPAAGPASGASGASNARTLWDAWSAEGEPALGLVGSGSDYTVFLHHLGIPVLNVSFHGAGGGQYHTSYDDFLQMDRFLDPTWVGHETAGHLLAELLSELAERGRDALDGAEVAHAIAREALTAGAEEGDGGPWLGEERAERLAEAWAALARAIEEAPGPVPDLFRSLGSPLPDRPWYRNRLWAPGLETGYAAETWPTLRLAARTGEAELEVELDELVAAVRRLEESWPEAPSNADGATR